MDKEAGPELSGELFRALAFIAEEGLPLTAKGAIHKKNINRLAASLTLPEEPLKGLFPAAQQEVYPFPLPVMVILDLLLCLGLVRRRDSLYLLETEMLESWLHLSGKQMSSLLYGLVLCRYGQPDPAGQHFRYLVSSADYPPECGLPCGIFWNGCWERDLPKTKTPQRWKLQHGDGLQGWPGSAGASWGVRRTERFASAGQRPGRSFLQTGPLRSLAGV